MDGHARNPDAVFADLRRPLGTLSDLLARALVAMACVLPSAVGPLPMAPWNFWGCPPIPPPRATQSFKFGAAVRSRARKSAPPRFAWRRSWVNDYFEDQSQQQAAEDARPTAVSNRPALSRYAMGGREERSNAPPPPTTGSPPTSQPPPPPEVVPKTRNLPPPTNADSERRRRSAGGGQLLIESCRPRSCRLGRCAPRLRSGPQQGARRSPLGGRWGLPETPALTSLGRRAGKRARGPGADTLRMICAEGPHKAERPTDSRSRPRRARVYHDL